MNENKVADQFIALCQSKGVNMRKYVYKDGDSTNTPPYNMYVDNGLSGKTIIQIDILYFTFEGKVFALGFQYQGGTFKVNCMRPGSLKEGPYRTSTTDEIAKIIPIFDEVRAKDFGYTQVNKPRAHAYISMSKSNAIDENLPPDSFCQKMYEEMMTAKEIIDKRLKPKIEKIGGKFSVN